MDFVGAFSYTYKPDDMTRLQRKMGKWEPQRSRFFAFPFFQSVEKQWVLKITNLFQSCFFYCERSYTFKDAFSMENRIILLFLTFSFGKMLYYWMGILANFKPVHMYYQVKTI